MKRLIIGVVVLVILSGMSTAVWAGCNDAHNINSDRTLLFKDGTTGTEYEKSKGCITVSWIENYSRAWIHAKIWAGGHSYEFFLMSTGSATNDKIEGKFNIYKDGVLAATSLEGKIYLLSQTAGGGHYFKFYANNWHFSFYLDYRFDCKCMDK